MLLFILIFLLIATLNLSSSFALKNLNSKIRIDKKEVFAGEKININLNRFFENSKILINCTIENKTETYKLFNIKNSLTFTPKKQGNCTIYLMYGEEVLDFDSFVVKNHEESIKDTAVLSQNNSYELNILENQENGKAGIVENAEEFAKELLKNETKQIEIKKRNIIENETKNRILHIKDSRNREIKKVETKIEISENNDKVNSKKLIAEFKNANVNKIEFENIELSQESELRIEDIPLERVKSKIKFNNPIKAYAIDPTRLNFTRAKLTSTAIGNQLLKCKEWDFEKKECNGTWIKIMDLMPNEEYTIEITKEDPAFVETGISAINTKKPIYKPGENAEIFITVLDIEGYLVSNAEVNLTIRTPNNQSFYFSTLNNTIAEVQKGIYKAEYNSTLEEGKYLLETRAANSYLELNFNSSFSVLSYYPYDIVRETPFSIDPIRQSLTTKIRVVSFRDNKFNLTEFIPAEFIIINTTADYQTTNEEIKTKELKWVDLENNSIIEYTAVLPPKYPELYTIKSFVEDSYGYFEEARPWFLAADPATGRALIVYKVNSNNPYYNIWNGTSLSSASTATSVGARPDWIELASNPNSEEIIMATLDNANDINVQVWNGTAWISQLELETNSNVNYKSFDVAYESFSGRALVVYTDGTAIPKYYIWNGSSWLGEYSASNTGSTVRWVELASDPNSNYIMLVTEDGDAAADINVQIWNGSSWGATVELTTNAFPNYKNFGVRWSTNDYAIVVYGTASYEQVRYAIYNKTTSSWPITNGLALSVETGGGTDYPYWIQLEASRTNDYMILLASDNEDDIHASYWNGTSQSWVDLGQITGALSYAAYRPFDSAFETSSGEAIIVYSDNNQGNIRYRTWINGILSGASNVYNVGEEQYWLKLTSNPETDEILLASIDSGSDLTLHVWNGNSWSYLGELSNGEVTSTRDGVDVAYELKATIPPSFTIWNISNSTGVIPDYSNQTRGQIIRAYALWNQVINQSYAEHNGLGTLLNFTIDPPYTNSWTNYTLNTTDTTIINTLGLINISIWAKNRYGIWARTTPTLHFYLWALLNITNISITDDYISIGETTTITCEVKDAYLNIPIGNYNVSFYLNNSLIGSSITNTLGLASINYTGTVDGVYNVTCNISNDFSRWYKVSSRNWANVTLIVTSQDATPPVINYVYDYPDPVAYDGIVTIGANVTDNVNISTVVVEINNVNYTMNYVEGDIWSYFYNVSSLSIGTYNYTVYANDSAGLKADPVKGNFTITNQLFVKVDTDKQSYELGENVSVFVNVSVSGVGQDVG
ncbi:MAG: hypothetical protein ACPLWC_01615, partial [Candidatus Woesearchaeota archaeon]